VIQLDLQMPMVILVILPVTDGSVKKTVTVLQVLLDDDVTVEMVLALLVPRYQYVVIACSIMVKSAMQEQVMVLLSDDVILPVQVLCQVSVVMVRVTEMKSVMDLLVMDDQG
jgi:hypothetical protein